MSALDPRIVRVTIEIDGQMQAFEDLDILATGQKTANPLNNTCEVTIANLSKATRNYLLTETSPFNKNRTRKRITVEAGRKSYGTALLFAGEVVSSTVTQPPDIGIRLTAQTGAYSKGIVVARSGAPQESLKSIAGRVASDLGLSLNFQASDKQIANWSFSGAASRQVDALSSMGGVDVFVDDTVLVVKNQGVALLQRVRKLSSASGMIGVPEVTERGVKVKYLLDADTVLGGVLDLESEINPAVNGRYAIYTLSFEVASRAQPFYYIAEARRT